MHSRDPQATAEWLVTYLGAFISKASEETVFVHIRTTVMELIRDQLPGEAMCNHIAITCESKEHYASWNTWLEALEPRVTVADENGNDDMLYQTWKLPGDIGLQIILRKKSLNRQAWDYNRRKK